MVRAMAIKDGEMAARREPDAIPEETSKFNTLLSSTDRCCCFCFPCFSSRPSSSPVGLAWWERTRSSSSSSPSLGNHGEGGHHSWWTHGIMALKKIREWSEIVAGPKWKTFIRRFNRNRGNGNNRHGKFQYDPLSYALNFDEGHGQNAFDQNYYDHDYGGFPDFYSRYVSPSGRPLAVDACNHTDVAVKE
uniref:Uncharacterized protein LOC105640410 n=1 Tax=Rhizophora mucronata TaxID=61149 RepID=A0A2P2JZA9_RHIMU